MSDHDWSERFSRDLDILLAGKKVDGEFPSEEYRQLIDLAIKMLKCDFSGDCGTGQGLKERVLRRIEAQKGKNSGELCEEDLDKVAGGLGTIKMEDD